MSTLSRGLATAAAALALPLALLGPGCRTGGGDGPVGAAREPAAARADAARPAGGMTLTSPDFGEGEPIPRRHAYRGEGDNVPPTLAWTGVPAGARELALVVDDPDAPSAEPWVHDVLYAIPVDASPLGAEARAAAGEGRLLRGRNGWDELGWGGPMPPPGRVHHYVFTLYALDAPLGLGEGRTVVELRAAMEGHVLGTARLVGTYQR